MTNIIFSNTSKSPFIRKDLKNHWNDSSLFDKLHDS
jgi:hypothetical protein